MLMKLKYSGLTLLLVLLIHGVCYPVDDSKLTKTITRGYLVKPGSVLEINNKYGDVIIKGWDRDSVSMVVTITALGKDQEAARRLLDRTEIHFTKVANGVEVITELSKSDGWMRDFWNELSGYSQTIISKDQLTIDFEVFMPSKMDLDLTNKYGDVFLSERAGRTRVDLSNGNLKAEEINGLTNLTLKFGNADIRSLKAAGVLLKSAELNLEQVQEIKLESNSSTINLGKATKVRITSRTDKINIEQLDELSGRSSFTKFKIENLNNGLDLDTNYGSIVLENVHNQFTEITIRGNSTDVNLTFDHMAYFNTKLVAKEGKFRLPGDHGLRQVYTDGTEKFIKSTGTLGKVKSNPGDVDIDSQGGKVELDFAPFGPQSFKKN